MQALKHYFTHDRIIFLAHKHLLSKYFYSHAVVVAGLDEMLYTHALIVYIVYR